MATDDESAAQQPPASVKEALAGMVAAVRSGNMLKAKELGQNCVVPLNVTAADLHMGAKISEGAESSVFLGQWQGQAVAVKKARMSTSADLDRFRSELAMLAGVRDHPGIVRLLAAKALPPDYMLVLPLAHKSVRDLLHECGWRPSWRHILELGLQVAAGMQHIHAANILHRDLKPANLLASDEQATSVQITDFGIAVQLGPDGELGASLAAHSVGSVSTYGRPTGGFHKKHMVGTLEYMAPELLMRSAPASRASDVYAFAVTLNEVASGVVPFSDCTKDNPEVHTVLEMGYGRLELAAAVVGEGLRPLLPKPCPPAYAQLMAACWAKDPAGRPTFEAVIRSLEQIVQGLGTWEQEQQAMQAVGLGKGIGGQGTDVEVVVSAVADNDYDDGGMMADMVDAADGAVNGQACGVDAWLAASGSSYRPDFNAGVFEAIGPRESMEDRHVLLQGALAGSSGEQVHVLAVFDGHRGADAAAFCKARLPGLLQELAAAAPTPAALLRRVFLRLEAEFRRQWQEDRDRNPLRHRGAQEFPGCTAIVALLVGSRLFVANAGDSRGVLSRGGRAVPVSRDHTAADARERQRLQEAGASVSWQHGNWRVGASGLQVTRCIGDYDVKPHKHGAAASASSGGVTADPEVTCLELSEADQFLVLATDGLWDCVGCQESVGLVLDTVKDPGMSGKRLALESLMRGGGDNVTVVVAFLTHVSTLERVFANGVAVHELTGTVYGSRARMSDNERYAHGMSADEIQDMY